MTNDERAVLDELVRQVQTSPKYREIGEDIIRRIGARELHARRTLKEAVKATKNKLHQIAGAYLTEKPAYDAWLNQLRAAHTQSDAAFRAACREVMQQHASTRERLPILERMYADVFARMPPPRAVLDVACGLNPLALPWMPLAPGATYHACDLYADMTEFIGAFLQLAGLPGEAFVCDLVSAPPPTPVDLALVLKVLPPLERVDKQAGINLLRALRAEHILVSFPAHSLGGRSKGMAAHYEEHFQELIAAEAWQVERFAFPGELMFLVRKNKVERDNLAH